MIKSTGGKMWCDGNKKNLSDLLEKIPENEWDWYIYEVNGVGEAPCGLAMPEFEKCVLASDTGIKLSWNEVKAFAESLTDIDTCFLAALDKPVEYTRLDRDDLISYFAIINVFDSTTWEVKLLECK